MKNLAKTRKIEPRLADPEAIEILLVEDTESDARRTMDALRDGKIRNRVVWVQDGEQALDYLHRAGTFARARRPDLILLDWYLPKIDGSEVLAHVKENAELRRIPVVIMTSSREERDVIEGYGLGVNSYIQKPVDFEQFRTTMKSLRSSASPSWKLRSVEA